jgi:hypothetical protein
MGASYIMEKPKDMLRTIKEVFRYEQILESVDKSFDLKR